MEEIEELRAKAIASMSAAAAAAAAVTNPNSTKSRTDSPKTREEGELSSSDNDEIRSRSVAVTTGSAMVTTESVAVSADAAVPPSESMAASASTAIPSTSSAAVSTGTVASSNALTAVSSVTATPPVESNVTPMNKSVSNLKAGKVASLYYPASPGEMQQKSSVRQNNTKPFEMKPAPSKPGSRLNPGWYAPPVSNNNLVIRFSDDDSESDSEEHKLARTSGKKENRVGVDRNRIPPASSQQEPKYLQHTAHNQMKSMPRKGSFSRTFISSTNKFHGNNSKASGTLADEVSRTRSLDPPNKTSASQEQGHHQGMNSNSSKLENLRQQIAIKESQLKLQLRSTHHSKNASSSLHQGHSGIHMNNNVAKKSRLASSNTLPANEPDKKRMKNDESYRSKITPDGHATKSEKVKVTPLERNGPKDRNLGTGMQPTHKNPLDKMQTISNEQLQKIGKQTSVFCGDLFSRDKDGKSYVSSIERIPSTDPNFMVFNKQGDYGTSDAGISISCSGADKQIRRSTQIAAPADEGDVCRLRTPNQILSLQDTDSSKVPSTFGAVSSTSVFDKTVHQVDIVRSSECNEVLPSDRVLAPLSNNISQTCSVLVPEGNLGNLDINLLGQNQFDIQTLLKLEELEDKDLEEAQEHRHKCELEERDALKAYRKTQRALIEANERCRVLYQRREFISAQYRASITEDSCSLWSTRWGKYTGAGFNSSNNNISDAVMNVLPSSNHQKDSKFEFLNRLGRDSNMQCTDGVILHPSFQQNRGHNLDSEPCSEPDASTSELLHHKDNNVVNGICSPSNNTNISADEDEGVSVYDHRTAQSSLERENSGKFENRDLDINEKSEKALSLDNVQDCALLEASLRSELFARLGTKTGSKLIEMHANEKCNIDKGVVGLAGNKMRDTSMENQASSETEQGQISDTEGKHKAEKGTFIEVQDQSHQDNCSFDYGSQRIGDPEECSSSQEVCRSTGFVFSVPYSVFKLAFSPMKVTPPSNSGSSQMKTQETNQNTMSHEEENSTAYSEFLLGLWRARLVDHSLGGVMGEMGSYTCDVTIDPFWPICMFELRGKCNDQKCPWQHVKDYSGRNIKQHDHSANADCDIRLSSHVKNVSGARLLSMHHRKYNMSAPEEYLVGLDLLKACLHTSGSFLARSIGQYQKKGFSTSSGVPFIVQTNHLSDVRLSHDGGRHLGCQKENMHDFADPELCLDAALVLFSGEGNKLEGKNKALSILAQALEANPTAATLWIVYLHMFYSDEKKNRKDDMFSLAIRSSESSYGLWLMYVNSRVQLNDRLVGYHSAISALCQHASKFNKDRVSASACILDLFLQMVDCFRMSGCIVKAIQRIYRLLPTATDASDQGSMLFSDIAASLTVSDKCILWVCCVYFVIYKELPDSIVRQFEVEKEFPFAVEWGSVCLTADEKRRALELMKMGMDSVASCINGVGDERVVHSLAVNHVQCVAVLEGTECSYSLLDGYTKLYPTCVELVVLYGRLSRSSFEDLGFKGFEDALHNWPREIPGIQFIWNQYVQCALECGEFDNAEQLMVCWSQSFQKGNCPENEKLDETKADEIHNSLQSPSTPKPDAGFATNQKDELFGLLNLSLHRLWQKDQVEARQAIDKALKVACCEDLKHCASEHAVFISSDIPEKKVDASVNGICNLLNIYLLDARFFPVPEPLSRKFIQDINKSKTKQLVNNLLGPVSCDYTLINSVLEACYGQSLLPEWMGELKNMVDVVESLMELFPTNYWLALSTCRLISRTSNLSSVASASFQFWASSLLVNSLCQVFPAAPEHVWVEAADILRDLVDVHVISERFHQQALSVYPFSVKLWKSWYNLSKFGGNGSVVVKEARERGIKVD